MLYRNHRHCTEFVKYLSDILFNEDVKSNLEKVNFVSVFCDGSPWRCDWRMMCVDPENFTQRISSLSQKDVWSQDAHGIKLALLQVFQYIDMAKLGFSAGDSASVDNGVQAGLATKFRKDGLECFFFVWCLYHCLELFLKESLDGVLEPIKKSLIYSFYLYHKPSKKLRELSKLHSIERSLQLWVQPS